MSGAQNSDSMDLDSDQTWFEMTQKTMGIFKNQDDDDK